MNNSISDTTKADTATFLHKEVDLSDLMPKLSQVKQHT